MDKDDNKRQDRIIKIILIIIIILLLIHNCSLIKRKGKDKTPSGNVNIIEITCINNDKCEVEEDNKSSDNKDVNNNQDGSGNNTSDNSTGNKNQTSGGNSGTNTNSSGTSANSSGTTDDEGEITVFDKKVTWEDTTELKIFSNSVYTMEGKISPEASNTYQFVVKNSTKYNLKYNIKFIENNSHNINMKYKLKKNDTYLVDHYVSYNELNISNQLLNSNSNDTYYLEWKWISSDNDNSVGEIGADYNLKIEVEAESIND